MEKKGLNMVSNTIRKDEVAKPIYHEKTITKENDIIEINIWGVEKSNEFPEGIKYRLVYIHKRKRILGYDNERAKGHHRHYYAQEEKYTFIDVEKLIQDFQKSVLNMRRLLHGN